MTGSRTAEIRAFLTRCGWEHARSDHLAGDASARQYLRLAKQSETAILMDADPASGERVDRFIAVGEWLLSQGHSAPRILASDPERGFVLLEDLGDDLFARLLKSGGDERMLYEATIDFLLDLHRHPAPADLAPYDEHRLIDEAELFIDWYLPALTGRDTSANLRQAFRFLWGILAPEVGMDSAPERRVLVLRDFHAENLIWLPNRSGPARLGLLDFQDAVAGHPAYDLVSLLEDARRDVDPDFAEAMLQRYITGSGAGDADFRRMYAILGAQRNIRILGIFTRLWKRDGKPHYQAFMPRMWGLVERDLAHPALTDLRGWFDAMVPHELRRQPLPGLN